MDNEKGFTLIELILSLGLMIMVFSLIMTVFIANYKSFRYIINESELQFQAQYALNFIANKISVAKRIVSVRKNTESYMKKTGEKYITSISFSYSDENNLCYNFENRNNKIFYGNDNYINGANVELASYVNEMYACPIPDGVLFENAKAVRLRLKFIRFNRKYEVEQTVYMRNSR